MASKLFAFILMPFAKEFDDIYKLGIKQTAERLGIIAERVDEQVFFNEAMLLKFLVYHKTSLGIFSRTASCAKPGRTLITFVRLLSPGIRRSLTRIRPRDRATLSVFCTDVRQHRAGAAMASIGPSFMPLPRAELTLQPLCTPPLSKIAWEARTGG